MALGKLYKEKKILLVNAGIKSVEND